MSCSIPPASIVRENVPLNSCIKNNQNRNYYNYSFYSISLVKVTVWPLVQIEENLYLVHAVAFSYYCTINSVLKRKRVT